MAGNKLEREIWAQRIQQLREERGEIQEDLAKDVSKILGKKVSRETVNQWESSTRQLKAEAIKALALHFGCTTDYILGVPDAPKTIDPSLSAVLSYTHLSEKSVEVLTVLPENIRNGISALIEEEKNASNPLAPHGILYSVLEYISRPSSGQTVFMSSAGKLETVDYDFSNGFDRVDEVGQSELSRFGEKMIEQFPGGGYAMPYSADQMIDRILVDDIVMKLNEKRTEKQGR